MSRGFGVLLVLWAGSLWSIGLWVAPTLFYAQSDRHLAGVLAGRLFSVETYLGLVVAALALVQSVRSRFLWGYFAAAALTLNEWGVRPIMNAARGRPVGGMTFGAWHGLSFAIYLLAAVAVVVLVWNEDHR